MVKPRQAKLPRGLSVIMFPAQLSPTGPMMLS